MATWKAENSMLTQRGVEILNKLKAGIGNITITRIVVGSGRVSTSQLYTQTNISGAQKEMEISAINTSDTGSEIVFYITNTDFTESYDLHQIGVFVTHPDYAGEQLYHISQCEAEEFDTIPAVSDNPVTQGYSIYMEHGNSEAITLSVEPQGVVTREDFNTFKGNAVAGNLISIDSDGKLQDAGKSVEQLYNKNLLHNTDFTNPVDQKKTYIVVPGVPYYSNVGLSDKVGELTDYCRVTKVNDIYGVIVINAVSYYVSWSSAVRGEFNHAVGIDRWSINPGSKVSALFVENGGVRLKLSPSSGRISQSVTTNTSPALYAGKEVTASIKVESVSGGDCYLFINDGVAQEGVHLNSSGIFKVTTTISPNPTAVIVVIQNISTDSYCDIKISSVKLELGSTSSLAEDAPANYAEQASICAQYNPWTGVYAGATPYGYVEELLSVRSPEELDSKLDTIIANMPSNKVKFVIVNFNTIHPVLGGAGRVFRIDKLAEAYIMVQALGYLPENMGVVSEYLRSKYNGVWTAWARTYNTYFKPTPNEIGAFGVLSDTTSSDLNQFVTAGSRRTVYAINKPVGSGDYGLAWNFVSDGGLYITQYYMDASNRKIYRRSRIDNVWTQWGSEATTTVVPATVE